MNHTLHGASILALFSLPVPSKLPYSLRNNIVMHPFLLHILGTLFVFVILVLTAAALFYLLDVHTLLLQVAKSQARPVQRPEKTKSERGFSQGETKMRRGEYARKRKVSNGS